MAKSGYSTDQVSEYNESLAKVIRLATCWERINACKRAAKFKAWKNELDIVLDEIIPDAKMLLNEKDYKKYIRNGISDINKKIIDNLKVDNKEKLFYWLRKKERFVRYIQNLTGKGIKIKKIRDLGKAIELG